MTKLLVVAFCVFFCQCVQSASYNQRQTGELNVQLELNDIQIFALMKGKDDYVVSVIILNNYLLSGISNGLGYMITNSKTSLKLYFCGKQLRF